MPRGPTPYGTLRAVLAHGSRCPRSFRPLTLILPSGSLSMLISLLAVIRCFCVLRPEWCQPGSVPPMQCESVLVLRLFRETNEPEQARGPFEQVLPRGGERQAHVTFAELAERAPGRDG